MTQSKPKERSSQWYAIYVRSRAEKKVLEALTEEGIVAYLPLERKMKQWSDRKKLVETPLLSGYLFVQIRDGKKEGEEDRKKIRETSGFVLFVTHCGKHAIIPKHEIETLKLFIEEQVPEFDLEVTHEKLINTKKIEVLTGPFKGKQGTFVKVKGKGKLVVSLEALGTNVMVNCSFDDVMLLKN